MTVFRLGFDIGNDAFGDVPHLEVARILRAAAERIDQHGLVLNEIVPLRDINGGTVGNYRVSDDI